MIQAKDPINMCILQFSYIPLWITKMVIWNRSCEKISLQIKFGQRKKIWQSNTLKSIHFSLILSNLPLSALTLSLRTTPTLVLAIFDHFLLPLEEKTNFIKFCTKFHVKQADFLTSKCTSLLLGSKPVQRNYLHFFKD